MALEGTDFQNYQHPGGPARNRSKRAFGWTGHGSGMLRRAVWTAPFVVLVFMAALFNNHRGRRPNSGSYDRLRMVQIQLSLLNFESGQGQFPYTPEQLDSEGKPLLSWRVHILPYLEQKELYNQFHLDEPWDSPHNLSLIPQMPKVYSHWRQDPTEGRTTIRAISGDRGMIPYGPGRTASSVQDGLSQTISLVQVAKEHSIEWTNPEPFSNQTSQLHRYNRDTVLIVWADSSTEHMPMEALKSKWQAGLQVDDHRFFEEAE